VYTARQIATWRTYAAQKCAGVWTWLDLRHLRCSADKDFRYESLCQTRSSKHGRGGRPPNHAFSVGQIKCAWTKPWKIAGIAGKEGIGTFSGEVEGNKSRFHAYYVDTMENGDKAHYRYQGTATLKDGAPQSEEGTWTLVRGTGKLKGLTGKGTYKGTVGADGTMTYEVEGEYQAPAKPS